MSRAWRIRVSWRVLARRGRALWSGGLGLILIASARAPFSDRRPASFDSHDASIVAAVPLDPDSAVVPAPPAAPIACRPRFPDEDGWFGGDAAYSIPLTNDPTHRSVWLFGDSFVRRPGSPAGRQYPFIHNSIAISQCNPNGEWRLDYHWQRNAKGEPRAFFAPDPSRDWVHRIESQTGSEPYYWPFDGFLSGDVLFVGLLRVAAAEPVPPLNLPFRPVGVDLARIENPQDPPEEWQVRISTLSESPSAFPTSAFVVEGDFVYAFGFVDDGRGASSQILSRIRRADLDSWRPDLQDSIETLSNGPAWTPGIDLQAATVLMDDGASEMSVHFDATLDAWIALYSSPRSSDSKRRRGTIWVRTARRLVGPWSPRRPLFQLPELAEPTNGALDPNLFCYAAKAHPQHAARGRILVTYVCSLYARERAESLTVLERLRARTDLYRARAISIPLHEILRTIFEENPPCDPESGSDEDRAATRRPRDSLPTRMGASVESGGRRDRTSERSRGP